MRAVIALIVLVIIAFVFVRNDDESTSSDDRPSHNANLVGRFIRWEPVDESSGYAYIEVQNRGATSAVAECTVRVSNDFGDFGFDYLVGETIAAGDTLSGRVPIDVGEGSFTINHGEVTDC
jgi:hypothetical protein